MPVVRFDARDLNRLVGKAIPRSRLVSRLPMLGGDLEGVNGDEVAIEFFPNRPDLLSVEGIARAARAFFDIKPGLPTYDVKPGSEEVVIEPSVAKVRPHIAFARVEGVTVDEARLKDLIDLQERLTLGLGRRRRRVAIGIHDARDVTGPYVYRAVARDAVRFVPLGRSQKMTPAQIIKNHEKGRAYAHLVSHAQKVPMILDSDGQVLSFPPIINGTRTQLSTRTREVLIDVTGTDKDAVDATLAIVATALAERGGTIRTMRHRQGPRSWVSPRLRPAKWKLRTSDVKRILGLDLSATEMATCLRRLAHDVKSTKGDTHTVLVGAWRVDLLHPVDLVEDVAIGYGFENVEPRLPETARFGTVRPATRKADKARALLLGQGFTEVVTLTLTGENDAVHALPGASFGAVEVLNPVTEQQNMLRTRLLPSLLGTLRANKRNPLPQSVFEVGLIVPFGRKLSAARNELRAGAARIASRASFSEAKAVAQAFCADAGIRVEIRAGFEPGFLGGRTGLLTSSGRQIGVFGEVDPVTLEAFELEAPVYALEVTLDRNPSIA